MVAEASKDAKQAGVSAAFDYLAGFMTIQTICYMEVTDTQLAAAAGRVALSTDPAAAVIIPIHCTLHRIDCAEQYLDACHL